MHNQDSRADGGKPRGATDGSLERFLCTCKLQNRMTAMGRPIALALAPAYSECNSLPRLEGGPGFVRMRFRANNAGARRARRQALTFYPFQFVSYLAAALGLVKPQPRPYVMHLMAASGCSTHCVLADLVSELQQIFLMFPHAWLNCNSYPSTMNRNGASSGKTMYVC